MSSIISLTPYIYSPITSTSPASEFVGIDQSITYGTAQIPILSETAGIADTGTTLILIASGKSSNGHSIAILTSMQTLLQSTRT